MINIIADREDRRQILLFANVTGTETNEVPKNICIGYPLDLLRNLVSVLYNTLVTYKYIHIYL